MFAGILFYGSIIAFIVGIMGFVLGYLPAKSAYQKAKNDNNYHKAESLRETKDSQFWTTLVIAGIGLVVLIIMFFSSVMFTIGKGEVGVRFDPFGKEKLADGSTTAIAEAEYDEGIHFKAPWASVEVFNVKTQDYTMVSAIEEGELSGKADTVQTVTSEGLYVGLDITVLYRIDPTKADVIRRTIGADGDYQIIVVRPAIRSTIRDVVSGYTAYDIYGPNKALVQDDIFAELESKLLPRNIIVESVLLRDVQLPQLLVDAIEAKKEAEQDAQRMVYIIEYEALEKDRKIIESEGIAEANRIINASLSTQYLTWYWIKEGLSATQSSVYIIDGETGLPIFKDIDNPPATTEETEDFLEDVEPAIDFSEVD